MLPEVRYPKRVYVRDHRNTHPDELKHLQPKDGLSTRHPFSPKPEPSDFVYRYADHRRFPQAKTALGHTDRVVQIVRNGRPIQAPTTSATVQRAMARYYGTGAAPDAES
jgi:hypothetical protein